MPQIDPKNGWLETLAPQAPITEEAYFKSHIILKQNQINIIQKNNFKIFSDYPLTKTRYLRWIIYYQIYKYNNIYAGILHVKLSMKYAFGNF